MLIDLIVSACWFSPAIHSGLISASMPSSNVLAVLSWRIPRSFFHLLFSPWVAMLAVSLWASSSAIPAIAFYRG